MQGRIPILLALSFFCCAFAQIIYAYNDFYHLTPFPSWADVGYLSSYPLLYLAILFLPTRPLSGIMRLRVLLDSLVIIVAIITFSWYFILGPIILQGDGTILAKIVGAAYPVGDLISVFCLLFLSLRSTNPDLRPALILLSPGLLICVCGDSIYDYQILHNAYVTGSLIDLVNVFGTMLIGLAGYILCTSTIRRWTPAMEVSKHASSTTHQRWIVWLPYILIPAVMILVVCTWWTSEHGPLELGVITSSMLLIVLVLARQMLAVRETAIATRQTQFLNGELSSANARLETLATIDPLTELPNHRALVKLLDLELARTQRLSHSCAVLFLDIDHFKALNDGYGHAIGDLALRDFAALVRSQLRSSDVIGRWGGEEFVAILQDVNPEEAISFAERVRSTVASFLFDIGGGLRLTCSIGLACYPSHQGTRETLLQVADQAMYGAKRLGRNQVRMAYDPAVLALTTEMAADGREEVAVFGMVEALATLIDTSTGSTIANKATVDLIKHLALMLQLSPQEAQMIALAGQLRDIGKVTIPDVILQKPTRLTEEEWVIMRTHTIVGADVVSHVPALCTLAPLIRAHHEHWDGKGYPDHLATTAIPLGARIIAVVDAYAAMIVNRPYQQACESSMALKELRRCAGTQFDPSVVEVLERLMETNHGPRPLEKAGAT